MSSTVSSAGRRTKAERTKALAAVFKAAGLERHGSDWEIVRNDLRWLTFLSVVRDPDGDIYNVSCALYQVDVLQPAGEGEVVVQFGLSDVCGVDARREYSSSSDEAEDPLVRDVRTILVPLITAHATVKSVLDAMIDGELVTFRPRDDCPVVSVLGGWRAAQRLGFIDEAQRAEALIRTRDWDRKSRRYFADTARGWGIGVRMRPRHWWQRTAPGRRDEG